MSQPIQIRQVDHIGIRVADAARSEAFYAKLGFAVVYRFEPHRVVILRNTTGVEINLIVNAPLELSASNILMDVEQKHPGFTHVALRVDSLDETILRLNALGIPLSGEPVRLGNGKSLFVRDPDRNVIELREIDTR